MQKRDGRIPSGLSSHMAAPSPAPASPASLRPKPSGGLFGAIAQAAIADKQEPSSAEGVSWEGLRERRRRGNLFAGSPSPAQAVADDSLILDAKKRLQNTIDEHVEAIEQVRPKLLGQMDADMSVEGVRSAVESAVNGSLDSLSRRLVESATRLAEAEAGSAKKRIKESNATWEAKLATVRKASEMKLGNQQVAMEATFTRKYDEKMRHLVDNGDSLTKDLHKQVEDMRQELRRKEGVEDRLTEVNKAKEAVEAERTKARGRIEELDAEAAEMRTHAAATILQLDERTSELSAATSRAQQLTESLNENEVELEQARENLATMQAEREAEHAQFEQMQTERNGARAERDELVTRLADTEAKAKAELDRVKAEAAAEVGKLRAQAAQAESAKKRVEELSGIVQTLEASAAQMTEALATSEATLEQVRAAGLKQSEELGTARKRIAEVEEEKEAAVAERQARLDAALADAKRLEGELEGARTENVTLSARLKEMMAALKDREEEVKKLNDEMARKVEEATREVGRRAEALQAKVDALTKELEEAHATIAALRAEITELTAQLEVERSKCAAFEKKEEQHQAETQRLLDEKSAEHANAMESMRAELTNAQKAVDGLRAELKTSQDDLGVANAELAKWRAGAGEGVDAAWKEVDRLKKALAKMGKIVEASAAAMQDNVNASKAERASLVDAALSSLRSLNNHLTYTLTGLRPGQERPPIALQIKSLFPDIKTRWSSVGSSAPVPTPIAAPTDSSDIRFEHGFECEGAAMSAPPARLPTKPSGGLAKPPKPALAPVGMDRRWGTPLGAVSGTPAMPAIPRTPDDARSVPPRIAHVDNEPSAPAPVVSHLSPAAIEIAGEALTTHLALHHPFQGKTSLSPDRGAPPPPVTSPRPKSSPRSPPVLPKVRMASPYADEITRRANHPLSGGSTMRRSDSAHGLAAGMAHLTSALHESHSVGELPGWRAKGNGAAQDLVPQYRGNLFEDAYINEIKGCQLGLVTQASHASAFDPESTGATPYVMGEGSAVPPQQTPMDPRAAVAATAAAMAARGALSDSIREARELMRWPVQGAVDGQHGSWLDDCALYAEPEHQQLSAVPWPPSASSRTGMAGKNLVAKYRPKKTALFVEQAVVAVS